VTDLPVHVRAVVAQLDTAFIRGHGDVFDRLVSGRGLSAAEVEDALRDAGVDSWQEPPVEWGERGSLVTGDRG
jgi:hypothetical protein